MQPACKRLIWLLMSSNHNLNTGYLKKLSQVLVLSCLYIQLQLTKKAPNPCINIDLQINIVHHFEDDTHSEKEVYICIHPQMNASCILAYTNACVLHAKDFSKNISYNTAAENSTLPIFIPYLDSTTSLPRPPEVIFAHPLWSWCLPFLIYSLTNLADPPKLISSTKINHFTSMNGQVLWLNTTEFSYTLERASKLISTWKTP